MYGYSLGAVKLRGLLMAVEALALLLGAIGASGGVARSDPAPSTDLTFNVTPDKISWARQPN
jgi:hypothetical protein